MKTPHIISLGLVLSFVLVGCVSSSPSNKVTTYKLPLPPKDLPMPNGQKFIGFHKTVNLNEQTLIRKSAVPKLEGARFNVASAPNPGFSPASIDMNNVITNVFIKIIPNSLSPTNLFAAGHAGANQGILFESATSVTGPWSLAAQYQCGTQESGYGVYVPIYGIDGPQNTFIRGSTFPCTPTQGFVTKGGLGPIVDLPNGMRGAEMSGVKLGPGVKMYKILP